MTESETTAPAITSFPAGYTPHDTHNGKEVWAAWYNDRGEFYTVTRLSLIYAVLRGMVELDNDGNVQWVDSKLTADDGWRFAPIPDSAQPADGMTGRHTYFNTETNKWELPDISGTISASIEDQHDNDISSAVQNHRQWENIERLVLKAYPGRGGADQSAKRAFYRDWGDTAKSDDCILIADAWRKSLGKVTYPEKAYVLAQTARSNGKAICDLPDSKFIGHPRIKFIDKLIDVLVADGELAFDADTREFPRGVIFVTALSTPANPLERTVTAVLATIKTALGGGGE